MDATLLCRSASTSLHYEITSVTDSDRQRQLPQQLDVLPSPPHLGRRKWVVSRELYINAKNATLIWSALLQISVQTQASRIRNGIQRNAQGRGACPSNVLGHLRLALHVLENLCHAFAYRGIPAHGEPLGSSGIHVIRSNSISSYRE